MHFEEYFMSSPNLPRMPFAFAFQVISFTYFSFGVNYTAILSEKLILIKFFMSITSFNLRISDTKEKKSL
jgi:hypothetical protein